TGETAGKQVRRWSARRPEPQVISKKLDMKLGDVAPADAKFEARHAEIEIRDVTADSRTVKRGDLFVAVAGGKADGLQFVDTAIASGAVAVGAARRPAKPLPSGTRLFPVSNARPALPSLAAN